LLCPGERTLGERCTAYLVDSRFCQDFVAEEKIFSPCQELKLDDILQLSLLDLW